MAKNEPSSLCNANACQLCHSTVMSGSGSGSGSGKGSGSRKPNGILKNGSSKTSAAAAGAGTGIGAGGTDASGMAEPIKLKRGGLLI